MPHITDIQAKVFDWLADRGWQREKIEQIGMTQRFAAPPATA